jgi:two-component system response regulator FixJ
MFEDACVHIIDDDSTVRKALSYFVGAAGFASRLYDSGEQFLAAAPRAAAGCIVTDVRMPGMTGLELVLRLKADGITQPVVVMSGHADILLAVEAMKAGAADFLQKPFKASELVEAVRGALDQERPKAPLPPESAAFLKLVSTLSPRQRNAFDGILDGKLNKTTAHELGISVRTLEGYRAEVMAKTNAGSTTELVRMAAMANLWGTPKASCG